MAKKKKLNFNPVPKSVYEKMSDEGKKWAEDEAKRRKKKYKKNQEKKQDIERIASAVARKVNSSRRGKSSFNSRYKRR